MGSNPIKDKKFLLKVLDCLKNNDFFTKHFYGNSLNDLKSKKLSAINSLTQSSNMAICYNFENLTFLPENQMSLSVEHIKLQELGFLSEYFLITALFCLTLFALFSVKLVVNEKHFLVKFQYNNQLIFLLIFILTCYLILVYQQMNISLLALTSFNDTIYNDQLSFISRLIIGISSILYLLFVTQYLKDQKLSNFEYYIILLTSIFGFFLLCCVNDLITAYLAIELQGLAFYVLASFKKSSNFSIESGVKYFVLGSLSTALFLLGVTFIYGLSGSILLTDFKDFFIWVFSANSFFLSFEFISQALEVFQEKTSAVEDLNSNMVQLQAMADKLNLLGKHTNFGDLDIQNNFSNEVSLYNEIFGKFLNYYHESNSISLLNNLDSSVSSNQNFLQTSAFVFSLNDFLIENNFQSASVELLNVSYDNQVDFTNFKAKLLEANYYEDTSLSNNFSPTFFVNDQFLNNVDSLVEYNTFIKNLSNFSNGASTLESITAPAEALTAQSVINLVNMNYFFSESFDSSSVASSFMFDLSFAIFGMLIIILALFFKLALAPFHLWAPDVYEGSPSSSTFFFMVISKFGIFVFLLRICYLSFYSFIYYWQFYSLLVATISIFIGAVGGLKQRRLKSLLTYSSINNMGFVLLAFSAGSFEGVQVKFYYLIVYMLASVCIWSIILNLQLKKKTNFEKQNRDLGDLALLQESNSVVAQGLGITLFSLAGLPPMVGFLAKMGVFKALSGVSIYYFSVINILFSVIATFYYLRITKIIFFENILIGNLYVTINSKKTFIINLLTFLLMFLFINPMFLYLFSYKITLFLNKSFF